jgi:fibronectin type 3 domain-containing protein
MLNKRRSAGLLMVFWVTMLLGCPFTPGGDSDEKNNNNNNTNDDNNNATTFVRFVNDNDFSVTIYSDTSRLSMVAETAANSESEDIKTTANANAVFYLTYHIVIEDAAFAYEGPGFTIRLDEGKTTKTSIPLLSELSPGEMTKPLSTGSAVKIQNAGSASLVLRRGNYEEIPLGMDSAIINGGETAQYLLSSGPLSDYSFMKNTTTPIPFPGTLSAFAAGRLYVFRYDGSQLILLGDKALTIAQALSILPPENIGAKNLSNGSISLSWDRVGTENAYRVYRGTSSTEFAFLAAVEGPSYTDSEVALGTTYYYRISAVKNNVESEKSLTVVSARAELVSLPSPEGLSITGETANSISLTWDPAGENLSYRVYKGAAAGTVGELVAGVAGTSYTVTGLDPDTVYYFAVSAVEGNTESLPSAAVEASTLAAAALPSPGNLRVSGQTENSLTLSWSAVAEAAGYRVSRASQSGGNYTTLSSVSALTYKDSGLASHTTYYYRVTAYNDNPQADSLPASISGTTTSGGGTIPFPPAKPAGLVVSGANTNSVSLSWNATADTESYEIWRANSQSGASAKVGTVQETTYTDYTVGAGTFYYYTVKAVNASGASPSSEKAFAYAVQHYTLPSYGASQTLTIPAGGKHYYRLAVTAGQGYTITWQDGNNQDVYYGYLRASAWQNDGASLFSDSSNGYTSPKVFTATATGYVTVEVKNIQSSGSCEYKIYH